MIELIELKHMDSTPFDDSHLLDHILDGRESEATDSLEPEARKRFEELQRLHALLSLADPLADVTGLSHAQRDAVVDRFQVGQAHSRPQRNTPLIRLLPFRLRYVAAAAVVMLLTLLGWSVFGPSTTDNTVYANVFGGHRTLPRRQGHPARGSSPEVAVRRRGQRPRWR